MEEDNPVEITKERLEDYKSKKAETLELRHKLEHVGDAEGISHIESGMHSTTATAEQSAASSEELSALATTLAGEVEKFITE